jgi:hypothetical protein
MELKDKKRNIFVKLKIVRNSQLVMVYALNTVQNVELKSVTIIERIKVCV